MTLNLYSHDIVNKKCMLPSTSVPTEKAELFKKYDIEKCISWIKTNKYQRVCLQFPDDQLVDSTEIALIIEEDLNQKLFILGDTSYASCCVDYVAGKHVNADALIHFGRACLTSFEEIPTLFVFPKEYLDVTACSQCVINFVRTNEYKIIILYDVTFSYYVDDIRNALSSIQENVIISHLLTPDRNKSYTNGSLELDSSCGIIKKLGRYYSLPSSSSPMDFVYVYLVSKHSKKNLENFVISSPELEFYSYNNDLPGQLVKETIPSTIRRKLYGIERVKEAQRIGILVATLATEAFLDAINRIKKLCKVRKKKSYIISVGKLNVAKLANFPEIELFVILCCPETEINDKEDYFQPIVTMMEVELALNDNQSWQEKIVPDFQEFLPGGTEYKEINKNVSISDVSLISNKLLSVDFNVDNDDDRKSLLMRDPLTLDAYGLQDGLNGRSWQGLEMNIGNTHVEKASIGRKGTPGSGYVQPFSNSVT